MYYTVYKITNKINNKIYIGVHKTTNLNDGYMGSGKHLKYAQEKYGIDNFVKEYLAIFDNAEDMFNMESEIVNEEFVLSEETYNLKIGGFGGFDYINKNGLAHVFSKDETELGHKTAMKALELLRENENWNNNFSNIMSIAHLSSYENGRINGFKGKEHSLETKQKISHTMKSRSHQKGEKNSQYGKQKSEETLRKISETLKNKPIITCPHCKKESNNKGLMNRWHFDNCCLRSIS